jgi:hypothetical protein
MNGKYRGFYRYDNTRVQTSIGFDKTYFRIDITKDLENEFNGTVEDDLSSGGTPGIGRVVGKCQEGVISFIKQMPIASAITVTGEKKTFNARHPKIHYEGIELEPGRFQGTWRIKFGFIFIGLIPVPVSRMSGKWEMTRSIG